MKASKSAIAMKVVRAICSHRWVLRKGKRIESIDEEWDLVLTQQRRRDFGLQAGQGIMALIVAERIVFYRYLKRRSTDRSEDDQTFRLN